MKRWSSLATMSMLPLIVTLSLVQPAFAISTRVPSAGKSSMRENWIVADGSLLEVLQKGNGQAPASGSLGFLHIAKGEDVKDKWPHPIQQFEMFLTAAGTADTVRGTSERAFASSLLPSTVTGHRPSIQLDYLWTQPYGVGEDNQFSQGIGFRIYSGISRVTWQIEGASPLVSDVTIASGGARVVWTPINHRIAKSEDTVKQGEFASVTVEGGVTTRYLFFDDEGGEAMRERALRGEKRVMGPELGISLQIRDFVASMYLPMFRKARKIQDLPGLTGAHPQFQFSVKAKLFKLSAE